jgi:hypothetical protein
MEDGVDDDSTQRMIEARAAIRCREMKVSYRRAHIEIYIRQCRMMRLKELYGVAVGGRRPQTSREFIEVVHVFLE